MTSDCLVVGGGVIGLLTALRLAESGLKVTLIEQGEPGRESSWAGGGIVSPLYPWRYSRAVSELAHWSQDYYPVLAEHLLTQSGVDAEVHATGLYWFDLDDQDEALRWAERVQRPLREMAVDQAYAALPVLGAGYKRALFLPGAANVRNPRLVKALSAALSARPGVRILAQQAVTEFRIEDGRCVGVKTPQEDLRASHTVVAAGAWSGDLLSGLGLRLPVEPVKGQMILYKCAEGFLSSMIMANGRYAIPRRDGHVLVGSTLEYQGYDKTPTGSALDSLRASAHGLIPALAQMPVVGHWAGLRPGSPEGIPYIGELEQYPGLWLNCGHYRNGLVLAPASCELLKNLVLGEAPIIDPMPYAPSPRLAPSASQSPAF